MHTVENVLDLCSCGWDNMWGDILEEKNRFRVFQWSLSEYLFLKIFIYFALNAMRLIQTKRMHFNVGFVEKKNILKAQWLPLSLSLSSSSSLQRRDHQWYIPSMGIVCHLIASHHTHKPCFIAADEIVFVHKYVQMLNCYRMECVYSFVVVNP